MDARQHLERLVGETISTLTGRPNKVIGFQGDNVLVGTQHSPAGSRVPLEDIQHALDHLMARRELEISVETVGHRSAFIGAVLKTIPGTTVQLRPRRILLDGSHSSPSPRPRPAVTDTSPSTACAEIHELLDGLPMFESPVLARRGAKFEDGLYFFYEQGEVSSHTGGSRIVRVGNHPRKLHGLHDRLEMHYDTKKGKKWSVFRRYLGGALIRRDDPESECLTPEPGKGHWENSKGIPCAICSQYEPRVSEQLLKTFRFRVMAVADKQERNDLEDVLIATIAACAECHASSTWLGHHSYSPKVKEVGLWNSHGVGARPATESDLARLRELVEGSKFNA